MANILNVIELTRAEIRKSNKDMKSFLRSLQNDILILRERLCHKAASILAKHDSLMTISSSGLVCRTIGNMVEKGWRGRVMIAESRPMLEGKSLARQLSDLPIEVVYGTDCQMLSMAGDVQSAVVGADAVSSRFFINKIGTSAAAAVLGQKKILYVLADRMKYYDLPDDIAIPEMPLSEVWRNHPGKIKVVNRYFEKIFFEKNMIFINESGQFKPFRIKNILKKGQKLNSM